MGSIILESGSFFKSDQQIFSLQKRGLLAVIQLKTSVERTNYPVQWLPASGHLFADPG
jgi:hypothetical protein